MHKKFLLTNLLACILATHGSVSYAASDEEISRFKTTYSQYMESFSKGAFAESLPLAQQAMREGEAVYGKQSKSYAALLHNYGTNLMRVGRYPEALDTFEDTLDIYKEVMKKMQPNLSTYI